MCVCVCVESVSVSVRVYIVCMCVCVCGVFGRMAVRSLIRYIMSVRRWYSHWTYWRLDTMVEVLSRNLAITFVAV
jgi:hypothetical protein